MESRSAAAHRILEYLLTKAVTSGKAKRATLKVPYADLVQDWKGDIGFEDVDLVLEISTKWVARDDETLPMEVSEDPNGFDPETHDDAADNDS